MKKRMSAGATEDPAARDQRERERRIAEAERTSAAQDEAFGITSDLRRIYGLRGWRGSLFPAAAPKTAAAAASTPAPVRYTGAFSTGPRPQAIEASILGGGLFGNSPLAAPVAPQAPVNLSAMAIGPGPKVAPQKKVNLFSMIMGK